MALCATHPLRRQMTHKLFEDHGSGDVDLEEFRKFLQQLQSGMLKLEFAHYDMQGEEDPFVTPCSRCIYRVENLGLT